MVTDLQAFLWTLHLPNTKQGYHDSATSGPETNGYVILLLQDGGAAWRQTTKRSNYTSDPQLWLLPPRRATYQYMFNELTIASVFYYIRMQ